jgi:hypothetical protein
MHDDPERVFPFDEVDRVDDVWMPKSVYCVHFLLGAILALHKLHSNCPIQPEIFAPPHNRGMAAAQTLNEFQRGGHGLLDVDRLVDLLGALLIDVDRFVVM